MTPATTPAVPAGPVRTGREFWVNVYDPWTYPCWHSSPHYDRAQAVMIGAIAKASYRIHAVLKGDDLPTDSQSGTTEGASHG